MEVKIGVQHANRELVLESEQSPDDVQEAVAAALGAGDPLGATVELGGQRRTVDRLAGHDRRVILRLEGCSTREGAEGLRGGELYVGRSVAPALGDDEWWADDLQGCVLSDGPQRVGVDLPVDPVRAEAHVQRRGEVDLVHAEDARVAAVVALHDRRVVDAVRAWNGRRRHDRVARVAREDGLVGQDGIP